VKGEFLFLLTEALKVALGHLWRFGLWALTLVLVLAAGTALLLLPAGSEAHRPVTQAFLLATLSPELSEQDIDELAWRIWEQGGVDRVNFRFPGEEEPTTVQDRTLVVLLGDPAIRPQVQEQLAQAAGILDVRYLERTVKPPPRLPSVARILALVGLVLGLSLALWLGRWAMGKQAESWSEAIHLLRTSGLPEFTLRLPFLVMGAFVGLVGALIYVGLLWGALSWAQGAQAVRQVVPLFLTCGPLATALGLLVGILLGAVGGVLGYPPRRAHS